MNWALGPASRRAACSDDQPDEVQRRGGYATHRLGGDVSPCVTSTTSEGDNVPFREDVLTARPTRSSGYRL